MICLIVLHDPVALPTWIGSFLYKNTHSINPRQSIKPNSINYTAHLQYYRCAMKRMILR